MTIQICPIDYRRRLYANVVFSGGSTSIKHLDHKLQMSLQDRVNERLKKYNVGGKLNTIKVNVANTFWQKHVIVWLYG